MSLVRLRFPPRAGHVRTARLVAAATARRTGMDDVRLDELRVAVGEACTRALHRCEAAAVPDPVELTIDLAGHGLTIEVTDLCGPLDGDAAGGLPPEDPVVLALLQGLADAVEVLDGPCGPSGLVRLEWWA